MDLSVIVQDASGKRCYFNQTKCDDKGNFSLTFDFSGNPKGKYTVKVTAKDKLEKEFDF